MVDQRQRQRRLAGAGRPGDQHAAFAEHDRRGVDVVRLRRSCARFGRQRHDEARALDLARLGAGDVLGRQRAAMRLDDLPDDRQAKAGILAERLAGRPVGVEALEDAVDGRRRGCRGRCRRR